MTVTVNSNGQNGVNANADNGNDNGAVKPSESQLYFIDMNQIYEPLQPSTLSNVISLYGLDDILRSVARSNPDGSKGVKLRKSYKNHILDLPGKHAIPKERNLSFVAFQPRDPSGTMPNTEIKPLDQEYLRKCLNFDKTHGAIPGFDTTKLGMLDDDVSNGKRKAGGSPEDSSGKKKVKV